MDDQHFVLMLTLGVWSSYDTARQISVKWNGTASQSAYLCQRLRERIGRPEFESVRKNSP